VGFSNSVVFSGSSRFNLFTIPKREDRGGNKEGDKGGGREMGVEGNKGGHNRDKEREMVKTNKNKEDKMSEEMKRFDGTKDYWELSGTEYRYTGPEWAEEGLWIKEEFKEALLREVEEMKARELWKNWGLLGGIIGFCGVIFYLFLKWIK